MHPVPDHLVGCIYPGFLPYLIYCGDLLLLDAFVPCTLTFFFRYLFACTSGVLSHRRSRSSWSRPRFAPLRRWSTPWRGSILRLPRLRPRLAACLPLRRCLSRSLKLATMLDQTRHNATGGRLVMREAHKPVYVGGRRLLVGVVAILRCARGDDGACLCL